MSVEITDYWYKHYLNNGHCSLCGNSGRVNTTGVRTNAGVLVGMINFCICPNGQAWRRIHEAAKQGERYEN